MNCRNCIYLCFIRSQLAWCAHTKFDNEVVVTERTGRGTTLPLHETPRNGRLVTMLGNGEKIPSDPPEWCPLKESE